MSDCGLCRSAPRQQGGAWKRRLKYLALWWVSPLLLLLMSLSKEIHFELRASSRGREYICRFPGIKNQAIPPPTPIHQDSVKMKPSSSHGRKRLPLVRNKPGEEFSRNGRHTFLKDAAFRDTHLKQNVHLGGCDTEKVNKWTKHILRTGKALPRTVFFLHFLHSGDL